MLLFVDNIYRYTLAGTEVSALLGRTCRRRWATSPPRRGNGRAAGTHHPTKTGSITSIQAMYVPADDLTDPSPATTFAHLDATVVLSRNIASLGIYPAVDPLDSTSRQLDPNVIGNEALRHRAPRAVDAAEVQVELKDIIAILGMDELSEEDKLAVPARARSSASSASRSTSRKCSPARRQVRAAEGHHPRLRAASSTASTTTCRSKAFYMVGSIEKRPRSKEARHKRDLRGIQVGIRDS